MGLEGVSYRIALPPFDGPASASLPRLIAPRSPHWVTSVLPFAILMTGLGWVARRLPRRSEHDDGATEVLDDPVIEESQLLLFAAALLACVVTSPTGWVMSFVWALPIAPLVWTSAGRARLSRRQLGILGAAWIACAVFAADQRLGRGRRRPRWSSPLAYAADAWADGP